MAGPAPETFPFSALGTLLKTSSQNTTESLHPPQLVHLAYTVLSNLQYQHDWSTLSIHTHSSLTGLLLPRPLISGLPPRRVYVHPDEQAEILEAKHESKGEIVDQAEREWILPTHLADTWSLRKFAEIFDAIDTVPHSCGHAEENNSQNDVGARWRGKSRQKRVLLATLHDDSTVVYYIVHDGIIKPRQN